MHFAIKVIVIGKAVNTKLAVEKWLIQENKMRIELQMTMTIQFMVESKLQQLHLGNLFVQKILRNQKCSPLPDI